MENAKDLPKTRRAARESGSRLYQPKKPCSNGHMAPRYTGDAKCSECVERIPGRRFTGPRSENRDTVCSICNTPRKVNTRCKVCHKKAAQKWIKANRDIFNERHRERMKQCREYVRGIRETTPCTDCGEYYPWYVMEFDHVNGRKKGEPTIAMATNRGNIKTLIEEMKKCEIVCSNCHSTRTHLRAVESGIRYDYKVDLDGIG